MSNPYEGKIGIFYIDGRYAPNVETIDELLAELKAKAPNIGAIYVKTNNGAVWQSQNDTSGKADLRVDGVTSVAHWVERCAAAGIDFHAWCVLRGTSPTSEIELIADVCNVPGVSSMILDVEEGPLYFVGGPMVAQQIAEGVRLRIPDGFQLGLCLDARGNHPHDNYIDRWLPSVDSLLPMVYYVTFGVAPDTAVNNALRSLEVYGMPVFPILQSYATSSPDEIITAADTALNSQSRVRPTGISLWRYGVMKDSEFAAVAQIPALAGASARAEAHPVVASGYTNQQVINAFAKAAEAMHANYWNWIVSANLTTLATDRSRIYSGVSIDLLPGLDAQQKELIKRALAGQPLDTVMDERIIGRFSNQQVINAFFQAAHAAGNDDGWSWVVSAGLTSLADNRTAMYAGPEVSFLPNLTDAQKQSILSFLLGMSPALLTNDAVQLDVPWESQIDAHGSGNMDCGQACVLMMLKYHNQLNNLTLDDIATQVDTENDGTTSQDLINLAAMHGLTLGLNSMFSGVDQLRRVLKEGCPFILFVDYQSLGFPSHLGTGTNQGAHWLLVVGYDHDDFLVHDPLWAKAQESAGLGGSFMTISRDTLNAAMLTSGGRFQALYKS